MRATDLLRETFTAITANRLRSALTILGIVIGIGSVIAMTAIIDGIKVSLMSSLGLDQSRLVYISCWQSVGELSSNDIEETEAALSDYYEFITGYADAWTSAKSETVSSDDLDVIACEPEYFRAQGLEASTGRLFDQDDLDSASRVILLNGAAVREFFGDDEDVIGEKLTLGSEEYNIIGVIDDEETTYSQTYIPLTTGETRLFGMGYGYNIYGFANEDADMDAIVEATESYLCSTFDIDMEDEDEGGYVYVYTMQSVIDELNTTMASFQLIVVAVSGIALLVGGIGIMNMMLTNVTERIREIGLRKALGATRADITRQFLLESVALCIVGGVLGIAVGYLVAWGGAGIASAFIEDVGDFSPVITPGAVAMATGICVGIGVVFGYSPARRAARLDPVESLRYQ